MKKLTICILILIMILAIVKIAQIRGFDMDTLKNITIGSDKKSEKKLEKTDGLVTVPSLEDEIETDTIWCGTFQLIWNDLKNDLAKQDIVFNPQSKIAENLNKETFTTKDISDKYYYKKIGVPTIELKQEIEKAIKEKFDEKSDILDDFNWDGKTKEDYFLYALLKKEFQFKTVFDEFENGKFKEYENIKYFGVRKNSDYEKRNQITVLYYDSPENFAIKLKTKQEDEVILCKNPDGKTFNEIYKNIGEQEQNFKSIEMLGHLRFVKEYVIFQPDNKKGGILKMMEILNGDIEDVVVFGDDYNDLDMFDSRWTCVAMGNACDALKEKATYVAEKNVDDGIYKICSEMNWF